MQNYTRIIKSIIGLIVLFVLYHMPEFFQRHYQEPLIWLLELGMFVFMIASYFVIRWQGKPGFRAYGLFQLGKYLPNLLKGLMLGFVFAASANVLSVWLGWNSFSANNSFSQSLLQTLIFVVGTLLPSLAEDVLTRGYLFAHELAKMNKTAFVLLSGTAFALNHIYRLSQPDVMIYIFILGLFLAWCLIYTGSLWLTLGIHWGSNIAYQFFTNVVPVKSIKDTGYDNYLLAGCYLLGWGIVVTLYKAGFFKRADTKRITPEINVDFPRG